MQNFDSAKIGLAATKVKDALAIAMERLEINDYGGEEAEHLEAIADGEAAFRNDIVPILTEAPAMLAELRDLVAANYGQPRGVTVPALDAARAILARIDATPTAQPAGGDLGILRTVAGADADWLVATASRDNPAGDTPTDGEPVAPAKAFDLFPLIDWQSEVANGDTKRGYLDWVAANFEQHNGAGSAPTASAAEPTAQPAGDTPTGEAVPVTDWNSHAGTITAAQGYVSYPHEWNAPSPRQVAHLLALSGISHGPIAADDWEGEC